MLDAICSDEHFRPVNVGYFIRSVLHIAGAQCFARSDTVKGMWRKSDLSSAWTLKMLEIKLYPCGFCSLFPFCFFVGLGLFCHDFTVLSWISTHSWVYTNFKQGRKILYANLSSITFQSTKSVNLSMIPCSSSK